MVDFKEIEVLTFDCYGTLIDWESGILRAIKKVLAAHALEMTDDEILHAYARMEADGESGAYRKYREVLSGVMAGFAQQLRTTFTAGEIASLAESLGTWSPFPDTVPALKILQSRYRLAIVSNVDDDLFASTARHLEVKFDPIVTAEQVSSYKPCLGNFERALSRLGRPREKVLHVAASVYHDIIPTRELGIKNVWVNRRGKKKGPGATKAASSQPDMTVIDLQTLAELAV